MYYGQDILVDGGKHDSEDDLVFDAVDGDIELTEPPEYQAFIRRTMAMIDPRYVCHFEQIHEYTIVSVTLSSILGETQEIHRKTLGDMLVYIHLNICEIPERIYR